MKGRRTQPGDPLTRKQSAVLTFIKSQIVVNGYPPSIREIGAHFKFGSTHGTVCHLHALRKKGLIDWIDGKARTIRVLEGAK